MALHPNEHLAAQRRRNSLFLLDFLHCTEHLQTDHPIFLLFEHDDHDLASLFTKERDQIPQNAAVSLQTDPALSLARTEAVHCLLKLNAFHGFSSLTALLAINYLDRILSTPHFQKDKPWMLQLLAVTCISLAAKVEEIRVPLLLDLQVEDSKYIFEAKTIQRMELLVLSALQWKMHPVTPVSFLGVITKRLGLKSQYIQRELFRRCERILLALVSDSRSVGFLPSVMAVSAMASVLEEMGHCNPLDFQDRLLNAFKINKGRVKECCNVISEVTKRSRSEKKRKQHVEEEIRRTTTSETEAGSPNGVIEANLSCESSNDSWGLETTVVSAAHTSSSSSSSKRSRPTR